MLLGGHDASCVAVFDSVDPVLIVSALLLVGCGDDNDQLSCDISLGNERTIVSVAPTDGQTAAGRIGDYVVTFAVLPQSQLLAEVTGADSGTSRMTSQSGLRGGGSMETPNGALTYSCS
jgi:hypothetical protein